MDTTMSRAELRPMLSSRFAMGWDHAALCLGFVLLFVYLNHLPVQMTTWHHANYGRWILSHEALPDDDPFLPLADGMFWQSPSWMAETSFAWLDKQCGPAALSNLLALVVLAAVVVWARTWTLLTGWKSITAVAIAVYVLAVWPELGVLRPQTLGAFCFALLFWMLIPAGAWTQGSHHGQDPLAAGITRLPIWAWIGVPATVGLWANLDGSFLVGMTVLACLAIGRGIEVAWRTRSLKAIASDVSLRRWTWLTELSFAATLINPYGWDRWAAVFQVARNPYWLSLGGWSPLHLVSYGGACFVVIWLGWLVLLRWSRVSMRPADVLLLAVFSVATACNANLLQWFAPLALTLMLPHAADLADRLPKRKSASSIRRNNVEPLKSYHFTASLVCILLVWCGFAFSPISTPLLAGHARNIEDLHDRQAPRQVSEYLREHPPASLIWAPAYWADWLIWDGPAGLQVFATTNLHRLPRQVQLDYRRVFRAENQWQRALDRYDVRTLVLDKQQQRTLYWAAVLKSRKQWRKVYEDDRAVVLVRRET
jgi:hypothetical protein